MNMQNILNGFFGIGIILLAVQNGQLQEKLQIGLLSQSAIKDIQEDAVGLRKDIDIADNSIDRNSRFMEREFERIDEHIKEIEKFKYAAERDLKAVGEYIKNRLDEKMAELREDTSYLD